jgi:hypothetical protein
MTVSAVGGVTSGVGSVYAALSPYLNGVRRTSDAAAAAALQAAAAAKSAATSAAATAAAIAARAQAAATVTAAPPFLNPAITAIADETALGQAVIAPVATTPNAQLALPAATATTATTATVATTTTPAPAAQPTTPPPISPTDSVAYGDAGLLVQSYGAVALLAGPLALTPAYGLPATPAVSAVAPVAAYPRVTKVAATA